jgi:hypothetical protein
MIRFHQTFKRTKAQLVDAVPSAAPKNGADNILIGKNFVGSSSGPTYRVCVGYIAPSGVLAVDCEAYVWDALSEHWFKLPGSATGNLTPGSLLFFDMPIPSDRVIKPSDDASEKGSVGFEVYVRVTDPGGAPVGDHTFVMMGVANQKGT